MIKRSDTLRDQAYELIRDKIIRQEIKPGERLSIADLSREFEISNSPIREAISLLETQDLVRSTPNHGFKVITLDAETFAEVAQMCHVMLSGCYSEICCEHKNKALARELGERLAKQEASPDQGQNFDYASLAIDFDRAFVDVCENDMLSHMFDSRFNLLVLCTVLIYTRSDEDVADNLAQHRAIYEAVCAEDHEEVRRLLAIHFDKNMPEELV